MKRKQRKTPTEIIEGVSKPHFESLYMKFPRSELKNISGKRTEKSVIGSRFKLFKALFFDENKMLFKDAKITDFHTHTANSLYDDLAIPSKRDFQDFLAHDLNKAMIIAQQDSQTGKVLGYTIIRKTKKTPKDGFERNTKGRRQNNLKYFYNELSNPLEATCDTYKLQYRFVPTKGNYFAKFIGVFLPKNSSKLEKTVSAIIATAGIIFGLFLLVPNFTGNVIGNSNFNFNWIGTSLLVGSLLSIFYLLKNKV